MSDLQKGHLLNFLSVLALAVGPLLSKFGLLQISSGYAALINAATIVAASFLYSLIKKNKVRLILEKNVILLAVFNSLGVIFLFLSMELLSPVEIGFLGRFYTVFAVILAVIFLKERLARVEVIFICSAVAGVFLFVEPGGDYKANLLGSLFALLYTFFFALTNIYIKKTMSADKNSNSLLFTNNIFSIGIISVYVVAGGGTAGGTFSLEGAGFIILSSLLGGFLGTLLLYEALKYLRFSIANVTRAFSPLLLAVISYPFFPIEITLKNTAGAILIVGSILFLALGDKKKS
ncbi:DMT family transporter [Evansella sp. LMS18]|jgi:drug/metabolite transporter (DMT)-like permease|uniref:DMT family transporter n=1 Tax=Evansella sp. LMS18 TaxID=2924033 RepID=UPI0020D03C08|nr:DMT family transporter [Evansella sp. LMS18]UTR10389.1 DMT family transporter [Evansella sp. LMS18]